MGSKLDASKSVAPFVVTRDRGIASPLESPKLLATFVCLGLAAIGLAFVLFPHFFNQDMARNLVAEGIGASVISGAIFLMLRAQERGQWQGAESTAATRLAHWISRMYMNIAIVLPPKDSRRHVEFADAETRTGYRLEDGIDFELLRHEITDALAQMAVKAEQPNAQNILDSINNYIDSVEGEFGVGTWSDIQSRLAKDLEMIADIMSRFQAVLARHPRLLERLAELDEIRSFFDGQFEASILTMGYYWLVFSKANRVADELLRLGYPCQLRAHSLEDMPAGVPITNPPAAPPGRGS